MKLYNANTDKIENLKTIKTVDGILYPSKLTEEQLNSYNYYKVEYTPAPNRRYYNSTKTSSLVGSKYVVGYTTTPKQLDEIKGKMVKDLFEAGEQYEATASIDTGLGFEVEASPRALQAFGLGAKKSKGNVRDKNFMKQTVTTQEANAIVSAVEDKLLALFETKEAKFDEILALPDIASCELYERAPYDYIITQEDVDNDIEGTLVLGDIIVRYKNKVKEW